MQSLDDQLEPGDLDGHPPELEGLLETAQQLQSQRAAYLPTPEFLSRTRAQLITQIRSRQSLQPKTGQQSRVTLRWAYALAVLLVALFSGSSVALAADDAQPGDGLFPLRSLFEGTRLAISLNQEQDARLHLTYAEEYLVDCAQLISQDRYEQARVALRNYDRHMTKASRIISSASNGEHWAAGAWLTELNLIWTQDAAIMDLLLSY